MTDSVVSRLGQINAAGATDALFLKKFAGEVLTAYEAQKLLKSTVRVRVVSGQKSAKFDATYRAKARYHVPGTEILGQTIKHNEITVTIDDLLISDAFVASIDELKNHYDVRAPYSNELGGALALFEDRTIAQCIIKAARGAALFTGDGAGQSVQETDIGVSADFDASGNDLISAMNLGKQKLEENKVPVSILPVRSIVLPAQWYLMANTDKNLNSQTGGQGASVAHQVLRTVSDIMIMKSPAPLFGLDVTTYDASTNTDGVVASAAGAYKAGYSAEDVLPNDYPTKYQLDLTATVGAVWCEPAVAYLQLKGLNMEVIPQPTKRGTLLLAELAIGMDALRTKCAVEIKRS
jgi:hypothetical protein